MSLRAPDAEEIAIVLLGSFNPGIFHPEWFRRQEILMPQETTDDVKITMVAPEITQVYFGSLALKLEVLPERFFLETKTASQAEKLQDILINLLTTLPHTPVTACGLNNSIQFDLNDERYWHKIGDTLAPKLPIWNDVLDMPGMKSLIIKGQRGGDFPGEVNVTVAPSNRRNMPHGLLISSNFHYPVPRNESGTARTELVVPFIEMEWKNALAQARRVADRIFDQIKKDTR